jgi:hypothetical protein
MSTKKHELEMYAAGKGVLGKAADDEPLFILRGQDVFAPVLVELWADMAERTAFAPAADAKINEARALASKMRAWPNRKLPD